MKMRQLLVIFWIFILLSGTSAGIADENQQIQLELVQQINIDPLELKVVI
jgi:hypothetical protein